MCICTANSRHMYTHSHTQLYVLFLNCFALVTKSLKCIFSPDFLSLHISFPVWLWDVRCLFSFCISVDVPRSLVLRLLCQGFIWQLHEEHNYTTREAIWHPQLFDRHHRRELWNRWVSRFLLVHVSLCLQAKQFWSIQMLMQVSQEYVLSVAVSLTLQHTCIPFE